MFRLLMVRCPRPASTFFLPVRLVFQPLLSSLTRLTRLTTKSFLSLLKWKFVSFLTPTIFLVMTFRSFAVRRLLPLKMVTRPLVKTPFAN